MVQITKLTRIVQVGVIFKFTRSMVNNIFRKNVLPRYGSVVYCDLAFGIAEHSGIYVGNGYIVHLNKNGLVEKVSLNEFVKNTPAITIYVSSKDGDSVGCKPVGDFALSQVGNQIGYHILTNNCHRFSSLCITQDKNNADVLLTQLKQTSKRQLGVNEWRVLAQ